MYTHTPGSKDLLFFGPGTKNFLSRASPKNNVVQKNIRTKKEYYNHQKKHTFFFAAARAATLAATRCVQLIVFHVDLLQGGHWSKDARVDQMNN